LLTADVAHASSPKESFLRYTSIIRTPTPSKYLKAAKRSSGLRTETTINDAYDFGIGRRLCNLPALRQIGFEANRRILEVEKLSHDCRIGQQSFQQLQQPLDIDGQHASALRFGDSRVQALFAVLVIFSLQPQGFRSKKLRPLLNQALGLDASIPWLQVAESVCRCVRPARCSRKGNPWLRRQSAENFCPT
jgi:hypothetical protein